MSKVFLIILALIALVVLIAVINIGPKEYGPPMARELLTENVVYENDVLQREHTGLVKTSYEVIL